MFEQRTGHLLPLGAKILVGIVFAFSVLGIVSGAYGVIFFTLISGALLFSYSAVKIDTQQRFYKQYMSTMGMMIPLGSWKHLPPLKMVSVLHERITSSNNLPMGGAQSHSTEVNIIVNLVGGDNRFRVKVGQGSNESMVKLAKTLANEMELDMLDARNPKNKVLLKYGTF